MSPTAPTKERLLNKVQFEPNSGCWLWDGGMDGKGYGIFWYDGRGRLAHRISYLLFVGELDPALHLDHLCCVKSCVNPEHLEQVTAKVNCHRAGHIKSHCPQGHPYAGWNLYVPPRGHKECRTCRKIEQVSRNKTGRKSASRKKVTRQPTYPNGPLTAPMDRRET